MGWTRLAGVCSDEDGFPANCGFGHEEWNLDKDAAVDGYVYGYTYRQPADIRLRTDTCRVGFWSLDQKRGEKVLVGLYLKAEPSLLKTDANLRSKVDKEFERRGVYQRRANELYNLHVVHSEPMCLEGTGLKHRRCEYSKEEALAVVRSAVLKGYLLWRCPAEYVIPVEHHPTMPKNIGGRSLPYLFRSFLGVSEASFDSVLKQCGLSDFTSLGSPSETSGTSRQDRPGRAGMVSVSKGKTEPHVLDKYMRISPAAYREIDPRHKALTNDCFEWLRGKGIEPVMEKDYIDINFEVHRIRYSVEVKIAGGESTTRSIREALGQMIEYNLYPGRVRTDRWMVLLDVEPTAQDKEFICNLRNDLGIPIYLAWADEGSGFAFDDPNGDLKLK